MNKRCMECEKGTVALTARAGRTMPYKHIQALLVPADMPIPTCDSCGAEWIDSEAAKRLDAALEPLYVDELHRRLDAALDRLAYSGVSQRAAEQALGLSESYISRIKGRRGDASSLVVAAIVLLAQDPHVRVKELQAMWAM